MANSVPGGLQEPVPLQRQGTLPTLEHIEQLLGQILPDYPYHGMRVRSL